MVTGRTHGRKKNKNRYDVITRFCRQRTTLRTHAARSHTRRFRDNSCEGRRVKKDSRKFYNRITSKRVCPSYREHEFQISPLPGATILTIIATDVYLSYLARTIITRISMIIIFKCNMS